MRLMSRVAWAMAAVLVTGLAVSQPVGAQTANTTAWKEAGPELRVYDIKALFARTPVYNFAKVPGTDSQAMARSSAGGGGGAGLFAAPPKEDPNYAGDAEDRAKRLQELIERVVKPKEPWESLGGRSSIDFVISRGLMFVSTTEDGHKQIETLVQQILPGDKRNVFIDIQIVELDRAALGDTPPVGFMARGDQEQAALKKATKKVHQSASLSGTDGQVLSSQKGRTVTYVSDAEPVVAEDAISYALRTDTVTEGFSAQVQADLSSDGTKATFDFRLLMTRTLAKLEAKVEGTSKYRVAGATIDLPRTISDAQAGTLLVPLDVPVVVAGGTVPAGLLSGNENDTGNTEIFYLVTVRSPSVAAPAAKR